MSTTLSLRIHSIQCVNKTRATAFVQEGNDDIYLGGFKINPDATVIQSKEFPVGVFDAGTSKKYDPPMASYTFHLSDKSEMPGNYSVGLVLFEKDKGGLTTIMQEIYKVVSNEINEKKVQYQASENTPLTDGPVSMGPVSTSKLWELAKPYVSDYIKDNFSRNLNDDIFPLQDITITITNNHSWDGKTTSPVSNVEFIGHGGVYQLFYDWELK